MKKPVIAFGLVLGAASLMPASPVPAAGLRSEQRGSQKNTSPGRDPVVRISKLREAMSDEIEAVGAFAGKPRRTPVMRVVPTAGELIKVADAAVERDAQNISGPGARFEYRGPRRAIKFHVLLPVSAHYGLPYKNFAATSTYEVWVEDRAGKRISRKVVPSVGFGKPESAIARTDLVTEVEVELPFDRGDEFKVSFRPSAPSRSPYTSGREIYVRRAR